jgi:hypothetical protein
LATVIVFIGSTLISLTASKNSSREVAKQFNIPQASLKDIDTIPAINTLSAFSNRSSIEYHPAVVAAKTETKYFKRYHNPPRGALVPRYTAEEFDSIPWSDKTLVIRKGRDLKVFHNYTRWTDTHGIKRRRYTIIEFLKDHKNMIHSRGFTVSSQASPLSVLQYNPLGDQYRDSRMYSWRWTSIKPDGSPEGSGQTRIYYCYQTDADYEKLHTYVDYAVALWHFDLGPKRGVRIDDVCRRCLDDDGNPAEDVPWYVVNIFFKAGSGFQASWGYQPGEGRVAGIHQINGDPTVSIGFGLRLVTLH